MIGKPPEKPINPLLKLVLEIGPLAVFFYMNSRYGIFDATAAFMVAIVAALSVSWIMTRHLPTLPLVTAVFVLVFGGLTIFLEDELFIKLKPTIVNGLFAAILFGGLLAKRSFLKPIFNAAFALDDEGWRKMTFRWAGFFLVLAVLNEIVWRTVSTDMWVNFKVFGIMPLTIVFSLMQIPLINRHHIEDPGPDDALIEHDGK